jgi:hypothetical protein
MAFDDIVTFDDFARQFEEECPICCGRGHSMDYPCYRCRTRGRVLSDRGRQFLEYLYGMFERAEADAESWARIKASQQLD